MSKQAVVDLTNLRIEDRMSSVSDLRSRLESEAFFPAYFGSVLYDLFHRIHSRCVTPDDRITLISEVSMSPTDRPICPHVLILMTVVLLNCTMCYCCIVLC